MSYRSMVGATLFLAFIILTPAVLGESASEIYNRQKQNAWFEDGEKFIRDALKMKQINKKAKNVILFIGDGMSIPTITAARILEGQKRGLKGEENFLSWEKFPYAALSKTYNVDAQIPDSAGTATAFMTGVKTKYGTISSDENASLNDCKYKRKTSVLSIAELAEINGLSTGVVTTAGVTHATPATAYSHSPSRKMEYSGSRYGCPDIAQQLIEFPYGNGLEVALGGGRANFFPTSHTDPEHYSKGKRVDGRNLADEWVRKSNSKEKWSYVWNRAQFQQLDVNSVHHVLGLFQPSHMQYSADRLKDRSGEPSLEEMTEFAVKLLSKNEKGFFLLVEGGRIDHAHHAGNAYGALHDAIALSKAVQKAVDMTNEEETLIIVTADHAHTMMISGYAARGSPILGLSSKTARDGKRYTTLGYMNGPGAGNNRVRSNPLHSRTQSRWYRQQSLVPLPSETHGGDDVAIYARGPRSHLMHGVLEQNNIFHVMDYALCLSDGKKQMCREQDQLNK